MKQKYYLLVLLIFLAYIGLFSYYPLYGLTLAFKDFSIRKGILGSPWVGLKWFKLFFSSPDFIMVLRNTLAMSILNIIFVFPVPILFALLLNEISNTKFKRLVQTISYLPHFLSWIVVIGIVTSFLSIDGGIVNDILVGIGIAKEPINFLGEKELFWPLIVCLNIWKETGWSAIIYLAAITSIDMELYEAAVVEGASRFRQAVHITIPCIMPTITMLFIFRLGYILNVGFEQQLFLQNPMNHQVAEVLDTYVFKMGLEKYQFSYATAAGMFKSVVGLILVIIANMFTRKHLRMGVF